MKKILFGSFIALLAVAASACSKNDDSTTAGKEAALTVTLAGKTTRALLPDSPGAADDLLEQENIVRKFTAFVFSASSGRLEAKGSTTGSSVTLQNLNTATAKRVVVIANTDIDIAVGGNISELATATNFIDLDDQEYSKVSAGHGMAMYGEKTVTLAEGGNSETITIERLAGKVALKQITVEVDTDLGFTPADLDRFKVLGVTMQKVIGQAGFLGDNNGVFYGGISGTDLISSVQKGYLTDNFAAADQQFANEETKQYGNFFYVLPNAGTAVEGSATRHFTMITVVAEFKDETVYFPVVVKDPRDGEEKVENNTSYTVSLKIKDLQGSPGPEIPKGEATLEVLVEVADWDVVPVQVEEW